ncbi:MAG: zinc metallopeptidase [Clostridia bacterium]|nr:zinc metallopeptidase [Clostridia bacterium]
MGYYYGYDGMFILVILVAVLGMIASSKVNSTFKKYAKLPAQRGVRACDAAQNMLWQGGSDAKLTRVSGSLTDHFNPKTNTVGLSESVFYESSVAALAVAAHEIGHVMQYQEGYGPIKLRNTLVPVVNFSSKASPFIVLLGLFIGSYDLAMAGVLLFGGMLVFQLVTLPVELNASRRAIAMLTEGGYITGNEEERAAKKVLKAAAMTYVVAALSAFVSFLRLFLMVARTRKRD